MWGADRKIRPRVTVWHCLLSDAKQWSRGTDISVRTKQHDRSFFWHIFWSPVFDFNVGVAIKSHVPLRWRPPYCKLTSDVTSQWPLGSWWDYSIGRPLSSVCMYEGWSKCSFLFLIQTKIRILSKLCDIHIDIRYISSNWMLFEKQLWRHSLWHVTSRDIPKGVIVVNRFSRVISAKFEILFRSKMYSIPLRNAHLKLIATYPNTI